MYRQVDGVAMGSPLGPVLANIFVGYCEDRVPVAAWPALYCRFVDDSFAYFDEKEESDRFLHILNGLHPALKFTCEHEEDSRLPFMDVQVEKMDDGGAVTSVYRKPTFTGLYITWDSFCAMKHKVNVVNAASVGNVLYISEETLRQGSSCVAIERCVLEVYRSPSLHAGEKQFTPD